MKIFFYVLNCTWFLEACNINWRRHFSQFWRFLGYFKVLAVYFSSFFLSFRGVFWGDNHVWLVKKLVKISLQRTKSIKFLYWFICIDNVYRVINKTVNINHHPKIHIRLERCVAIFLLYADEYTPLVFAYIYPFCNINESSKSTCTQGLIVF